MKHTLKLSLAAALLSTAFGPASATTKLPDLPRLMTGRGVRSLPAGNPAQVIAYGDAEEQKIELFLPKKASESLLPVVVLLQGDCWGTGKAGNDLRLMRPLAGALSSRGYAVWSIGTRDAETSDNGYAAPFTDVATAIDLVRDHAEEYHLDTSRILFFGHGSGAHLALWAAGRRNIQSSSPLYRGDSLRPRGVLAVDGFAALGSSQAAITAACGAEMINRLAPATGEDGNDATGDRLAAISPEKLLPTRVPSIILHGIYDGIAFPAIGLDYATAARRAGDMADLQVAPMAGHYEAIAPGTAAFSQALAAVDRLLR